MTWSDTLRRAETLLNKGDLTGAFLKAFGALETCYRAVSAEHGWRPKTGEDSGFWVRVTWLREKEAISPDDYESATHVGSARNVVAHGDGFEPSQAQVQRTIGIVGRLCSRFGRTVRHAMAGPVTTASPDQPVGELLRHMVEGISQFPVVDKGEVVGTLTDMSVLDALARGEGILDPKTPVRELMDGEALPTVDPEAPIEEVWRKLENTKRPALLVFAKGRLTGIVTKYDLLRRLEL